MSWRQEIIVAEKNVVKAQKDVQVAQRALALLKELAKLSDGGQVTMTSTKKKKKSKVKAETETEAPVKRGRGRPPKQKSDDPSAPKRGRGRPKKDKTAAPSETESPATVSDKKSLGELCLEIAREASEPKPIGHFIEELHKKNYSSKAKDFKNIVYQGLNHLKNEGHLNKTDELEYFLVDSK
jgi:hypothetical protein